MSKRKCFSEQSISGRLCAASPLCWRCCTVARDTTGQHFSCCDNSDKDTSPGSTPDTSKCQTVFAGVYAVGRGPQGTHAALSCAPHEITAQSREECIKHCAPLIKQFVQRLVQRRASAKAGASSMGTKLDGTNFDSTHGRWSQHLGAYYRIPE